LTVSSFISPKATKGASSDIEGRGLIAVAPIAAGEIVAIKGGHILDRRTLSRVRRRIAASYMQIDDLFYIGALRSAEVVRNKIFINHSCEPNLGIRGQITYVALRAIKAGEELTYDWAMEENAPTITRCACGARLCRGILTGQDWKLASLQKRYRGYFSAYIEEKIHRGRRTTPRRPR
jgi:SET domain-containing protein